MEAQERKAEGRKGSSRKLRGARGSGGTENREAMDKPEVD